MIPKTQWGDVESGNRVRAECVLKLRFCLRKFAVFPDTRVFAPSPPPSSGGGTLRGTQDSPFIFPSHTTCKSRLPCLATPLRNAYPGSRYLLPALDRHGDRIQFGQQLNQCRLFNSRTGKSSGGIRERAV